MVDYKTDPEAVKFLKAWDATKPKFKDINGNPVTPRTKLSDLNIDTYRELPNEDPWIKAWDATKPDYGTIELP